MIAKETSTDQQARELRACVFELTELCIIFLFSFNSIFQTINHMIVLIT